AQQFFQHLVGRVDDLGAGRVGALGDDHLRELVCQVDVRGLQGRAFNNPGAACSGFTQVVFTRLIAHLEDVSVASNQTVGVGDGRDWQHVQTRAFTVAEAGDHENVRVNRHDGTQTKCGTVLVGIHNVVCTGILGEVADIQIDRLGGGTVAPVDVRKLDDRGIIRNVDRTVAVEVQHTAGQDQTGRTCELDIPPVLGVCSLIQRCQCRGGGRRRIGRGRQTKRGKTRNRELVTTTTDTADDKVQTRLVGGDDDVAADVELCVDVRQGVDLGDQVTGAVTVVDCYRLHRQGTDLDGESAWIAVLG